MGTRGGPAQAGLAPVGGAGGSVNRWVKYADLYIYMFFQRTSGASCATSLSPALFESPRPHVIIRAKISAHTAACVESSHSQMESSRAK